MSGIQKVTMPKWGLSMREGKVAKWLIGEGDRVDPGMEIVDIETEKISSAAEAPAPGVLRRVVAKEGEVVPVSGLLAVNADPAVPDAEIEAFVKDFQTNFVPEEAGEEAQGPQPETVAVEGLSLRYLKKGESGAPVILLHGFGGDLNNWLFNHDALAAGHVVYALDLPGHGGSSKDVGDGSLDAMAGAVHGFMAALKIEKAHFVGHSMGGAIALAFALAHPGKARSLTLISSAGLGPEIDVEYLEGFVSASRRKDIKPHLEKLFADPSLVSRQLVDDILKFKRLDGVEDALSTILGKFVNGGRQAAMLRDRLAGVGVPVLVVWGRKDRIIPASHAEGLPSSVRVEVIEESGHMSQMEAAGEVNKLIGAFIG
jgi:pyruvate dehydrogenase E2 component (dihydrolipoamide acetyltransferase)